MDVWSGGTAAARACASPQMNFDGREDFVLAFYNMDKSPAPVQDHQYAADSSSGVGAIGKIAVPCKVCGDKASGYHYGVTSCEGCKGFFRRSIQKQIEYRCLRDAKCLVIRLNRNRCQFCRFKKCLSVGMSRDSVRYGRVPKRSRETISTERMAEMARAVVVAHQSTSELNAQALRQAMSKELVKAVTTAHRVNNTYTEELRISLHHNVIIFKIEESNSAAFGSDQASSSSEEAASSTTDLMVDPRALLWHHIAQRMTPAVQQVVEFAKRLPGFHSLPQDDQLILIKLGFFEVWLTRASRLSTPECIVFDDGTAITLCQLEIMYDSEFATAMLTYVWVLRKMQLSEEEMATFTATLLLYPKRSGLCNRDGISKMHQAMGEAFNCHVVSTAGPHAAARLESFAAAARDIHLLGSRHNDLLIWCRLNWPWLMVPDLFAEIFDIPKSEEDDAMNPLAELQ